MERYCSGALWAYEWMSLWGMPFSHLSVTSHALCQLPSWKVRQLPGSKPCFSSLHSTLKIMFLEPLNPQWASHISKEGHQGFKMSQDHDTQLKEELEERVMYEVGKVARDTIATAYTKSLGTDDGSVSFFVVADGVKGNIKNISGAFEGLKYDVLVVERELFETDVEDSRLLEAVSGRLLMPYKPLKGGEYLQNLERRYKRKKIRESLTGLALEYPELLSELLIEPRYFVHDSLLKLSHVLPQVPKLLQTIGDERHSLLKGYLEALGDLVQDGIIRFKGDLVVVERNFVDSVLELGFPVYDQLSRAQRQLLSFVKIGPTGLVDLLKSTIGFSIAEGLLTPAFGIMDLPRPYSFLHFPTAFGPSPLYGPSRIEDILSKMEQSAHLSEVRLQRFGGVLNEVYLLTYAADGEERKTLLKRYPNWVSLKWVPLALWTLGTQNFAVLGRSRLEKECTMTNLLSRIGIWVPNILHVSFQDRMLLREYVEGENLSDIIRFVVRGGGLGAKERDLIKGVGETVATVHGARLTLGDSKPGNFIIAADGNIFVVDLEQGARGGNETWDIAEFLYISGHHTGPTRSCKGDS